MAKNRTMAVKHAKARADAAKQGVQDGLSESMIHMFNSPAFDRSVKEHRDVRRRSVVTMHFGGLYS